MSRLAIGLENLTDLGFKEFGILVLEDSCRLRPGCVGASLALLWAVRAVDGGKLPLWLAGRLCTAEGCGIVGPSLLCGMGSCSSWQAVPDTILLPDEAELANTASSAVGKLRLARSGKAAAPCKLGGGGRLAVGNGLGESGCATPAAKLGIPTGHAVALAGQSGMGKSRLGLRANLGEAG